MVLSTAVYANSVKKARAYLCADIAAQHHVYIGWAIFSPTARANLRKSSRRETSRCWSCAGRVVVHSCFCPT